MRAGWMRAGWLAIALAAAWPPRATVGDDDVTAEAAPEPAAPRAGGDVLVAGAAVRHEGGRPAAGGIDLAAHVDINVVLPPNHWRVAGGMNNLVIAGGGRLVIEGNLTIGGEPLGEAAERTRKTDDAVLVQLRSVQRSQLAAVTADPRLTAAQRRALELATEADIRRVLAAVAVERARYAGRRANLGDEEWRSFQKDITRCRRAIADPFGTDSLFAEVHAGLDNALPTGR